MPLPPSLSSAWEVFVLFAIPFGGGIPAGVLLAKSKAIAWPYTAFLYLLSDIALACVFEPLLMLSRRAGQKSRRLSLVGEAFRRATMMTAAKYGANPGPFALVMIAFGVDPMTGRAAAAVAGHGFLTGWAIAITGDLLFFAIWMASTLWLDGVLGDGSLTMLIMLAAMIVVPWAVRKMRGRVSSPAAGDANLEE